MRLGAVCRCRCGAEVQTVIGTSTLIEYETAYTHRCPQQPQRLDETRVITELRADVLRLSATVDQLLNLNADTFQARPAVSSRQPALPPPPQVYVPPTGRETSILDEISA